MIEVSPMLSVIILNVNGLNSPVKRQRLAKWIMTYYPTMLSTKDSLQIRRHKQMEVKEWEKIFYTNSNQKRAGVSILISNKIDFKSKSLQRQRRTLYINKSFNTGRRYNNYKHLHTFSQISKVYESKTGINEGGNSFKIMVGDFNTPLSITDGLNR